MDETRRSLIKGMLTSGTLLFLGIPSQLIDWLLAETLQHNVNELRADQPDDKTKIQIGRHLLLHYSPAILQENFRQ